MHLHKELEMKKTIKYLVIISWFLILHLGYSLLNASATEPGDINNDGRIDLQDAISTLQVVVGMSPPLTVLGDANGDGQVGISEVIFVLQCLAGLRNRPPQLGLIGNRTVDEGSSLSFTISAYDPEGGSLTYTCSDLPVGAIFDQETKTFSWTPTYSQSGTYDITITVTDEWGAFDSQTITVTVVDKPIFVAVEYFPLDVGNWWDYKDEISAETRRNDVPGILLINNTTTKILRYADGKKEYYTSDTNGIKLYGQYVISPTFTADVIFATPLLLMPNNAPIGTERVSTTYSYVDIGLFLPVRVNVTVTMKLLGLEDVQTEHMILRDCIKASMQITLYIPLLNKTITGAAIHYWLYKGIGVVRQVDNTRSLNITEAYVGGESHLF